MRSVIKYLTEIKKVLEQSNLSDATIEELNFSVNVYDVFVASADFIIKDKNGDEVSIEAFSEIDMIYVDQYSEEFLLKQVCGDIVHMLEQQTKDFTTIH